MVPIKSFQFNRLIVPSLCIQNIFKDFQVVFHQPIKATKWEISLKRVASGNSKQSNSIHMCHYMCFRQYKIFKLFLTSLHYPLWILFVHEK